MCRFAKNRAKHGSFRICFAIVVCYFSLLLLALLPDAEFLGEWLIA